MTYAKDTKVSWKKSKQDIEDLVSKRGGGAFGVVTTPESVIVAFEMNDRRIRFNMLFPSLEDFARNSKGQRVAAAQAKSSYEKELRRRWRALLFTIKAKFVSVEDGIEVFDAAFMAQIVMPNGMTTEEWLIPQLRESFASGKMPPLLPPA